MTFDCFTCACSLPLAELLFSFYGNIIHNSTVLWTDGRYGTDDLIYSNVPALHYPFGRAIARMFVFFSDM